MNRPWTFFAFALAWLALGGCRTAPEPPAGASGGEGGWRAKLRQAIPLYGHRNWIVVADAAYPAQARPGIETVVANEEHVAVLEEVLAGVAASRHVRALALTDKELAFVADADAPGIEAYRRKLDQMLSGRERSVLGHEQIIARLDQAAQTFRVLVIKTNMALPYTSVFLQLDCGYWSAGAEERLRRAMQAAAAK